MHTLITERLKSCRERLGISKQEAARRIKVSQPAYLRYESGQRTPSIQVINEMALVFNTSVDYLTGISNIDSNESIIISKSDEPELFQFVSTYKSLNDTQKKHLLAYASRLTFDKSE